MLVELRNFILADPTVAALIGTRMYPITMPQKPTLPSVTYQVVSGTSRAVMLHDDNLPMTRVQIDAWSLTMSVSMQVDDAIRSLFHNFVGAELGGSPGVYVAGVLKDNPRNDYESDTLLYRVSRDYRVFHAEH